MKYLLTLVVATTLISCEKSEVNNVNVPKQTIVLKGDITTNTKLTSNNEYILEGHVYVKNCSQLTIEPGTVIKSSNSSSLVIEQCSKIIANGTSTSPIIFTSGKPDGQKSPGDFGGIVVLGYASTNHPTSLYQGHNCFNLPFGGINDNDNSGILRYIRIEYGSVPSPFDYGALTLAGVGRGTTVEYVQSVYAGDCSFYWIGGTVNASNLYSYASADDDFSFDFGYDGYVKNSISKKDKDYCRKHIVGELFNNGNSIECKNQDITNKITYPKFDNMIIILDSSSLNIGSGLYTKGNTKFSLTNSSIIDWNNAGIFLLSTSAQYYIDNISKLSNNKFSKRWGFLGYYVNSLLTQDQVKIKLQSDNNVETFIDKQQTDILSKPTWTNNWCSFPKIGY